jgi:hypothetical protein
MPKNKHLAAVPDDETRSTTDYGNLPLRQRRCRGAHHSFALDDWDPPEAIPRGVTVMPADEGRYKFLEPCMKCMAVTRVTRTHPGGRIDGFMKSEIRYGAEWVRLDRSVPRGRRTMRDLRYQDGQKQLQALIGLAVTLMEPDEPAARRTPPAPGRRRGKPPRPPAAVRPPVVRFQGA